MISISNISEEDIPLVLELWTDAGLRFRPHGRDRTKLIKEEIAQGPDLWIGAWDDNRLVGVVFASDDGRKGWINRLAVHPEYRMKGVARMLVEEAEKALRKRGRGILAVLIDDDNSTGMDVFSRIGYVREDHIIYYTKRDGPHT